MRFIDNIVARFGRKDNLRKEIGKISEIESKTTQHGIPGRGWVTLAGVMSKMYDDSELWKTYSLRDMGNLFSTHSMVRACIYRLAKSGSEAFIDVGIENNTTGRFTREVGHELENLLWYPNKLDMYVEFIQSIIVQLEVSGKVFIWKWRNSYNQIAALWVVPSSWVETIPQADGTMSFKINQGDGTTKLVTDRDMIYLRIRGVNTIWNGSSPLGAVLHEVDIDKERGEYLYEMLTNLCPPGLVFSSDEPLSDDQRRDARDSIQSTAGRGKRGSLLIVEGKGRLEAPNPLKDLDLPSVSSFCETRICQVFDIPPILVHARAGLDRATYANIVEARKMFYSETMLPLWTLLQGALTRGLLLNEGDSTRELQFRLREVLGLQEDASKLSERVNNQFRAGYITIDEARLIVGMAATNDNNGKKYSWEVTKVGNYPTSKFGSLNKPGGVNTLRQNRAGMNDAESTARASK